MGLDLLSTRYHLHLKSQQAKFDRVAMLGRQNFAMMAPHEFADVLSKHCSIDEDEATKMFQTNYAEPFYEKLGATVVDSFDISDYEGATKTWNMNEALPPEHEGAYDFVFDGGTLEHVFNFSEALRGAMALVAPGGTFMAATPANSFLGHGFYQFGPDLPFSIFNEANGYELGGVHLVEMRHNATFYEVLPPGLARGRALASTQWPTTMLYWGRRIGAVPSKLIAQQPDYEAAWESGSHSERASGSNRQSLLRKSISFLPQSRQFDILRLGKLGYVALTGNAFFDKKCFRPDNRI